MDETKPEQTPESSENNNTEKVEAVELTPAEETVEITETITVSKNPWLDTPKAIVLGALLIAIGLAVGLGIGGNGGMNTRQATAPRNPNDNLFEVDRMKINKNDHVFGNPDAPVVIFEFSDIDCPFCQRIHPTITRLVEEHPDTIAWVYRHRPLDSHPLAVMKAEATECVADIAGDKAFWEYLDVLFAEQKTMQGDQEGVFAMLSDAASEFGVSAANFSKCMDSDRHLKKIAADNEMAINEGTPYNVVVGPETAIAVRGAMPYEALEKISLGLANPDANE